METYVSSSTRGMVQIVKDKTPELTWQTLIAMLLFSCIATRVITGLQSRPRRVVYGEPQPVRAPPYWIPWLGHGFSFAMGRQRFIAKAREAIKEPVFSLYMGGTTHNMVLAPSMVKAVFADRAASFDSFTNYVLKKVFDDRGPIRNMSHNDHKPFSHAVSMLTREPYVTDIAAAAVRRIENETPNMVSFSHSIVDQSIWERTSNVVLIDGCDRPTCEANLFALTRNFVAYITTSVLMGTAFVDFYPPLLEDLWTFDSQFNALLMGAPKWLPLPGISAAYAARHRLIRLVTAFHTAFAAWDDGRDPGFDFRDLDDVSEPMKERMRSWRKAGFAPNASAPGDFAILWAMNVNSSNIVFWNLLHILADPALLSGIRREIAPYVKATRLSPQETGLPFTEPPRLSVDMDGLLNSCPLLKATYYETMRMDTAPFSYRELTADLTLTESEEDATLNGSSEPRTYNFRKGEYVVIPHGAHNKDPLYFPDPDRFDPRRFILTDPETGKETVDLRTLRPYGGGTSMCKGRGFAEREILVFTAAILSLWEIEPADKAGWKIPGQKPSSTAFLPKNDIRVRLSHRV
ncbi:hypothetical protein VTN02DRAFT_589 [Thermoascus thermophilus]